MAKKMSMVRDVIRHEKPKHVTSIGDHSKRSVPKNKNKRDNGSNIEDKVDDIMSL